MTEYPDLRLYIGGAWRITTASQPVLNPSSEAIIGQVPIATRPDLDDALDAARGGFKVWSGFSPRKRAEIMLKAAALMRERSDEIARAITLEHGKPFNQARLEIIRGCEFFEWDVAEGQRQEPGASMQGASEA